MGMPVLADHQELIRLLKKDGMHVWEELDDYRVITLLNTELRILVQVFANYLQLIINDLIGKAELRCERKIDPKQPALGL